MSRDRPPPNSSDPFPEHVPGDPRNDDIESTPSLPDFVGVDSDTDAFVRSLGEEPSQPTSAGSAFASESIRPDESQNSPPTTSTRRHATSEPSAFGPDNRSPFSGNDSGSVSRRSVFDDGPETTGDGLGVYPPVEQSGFADTNRGLGTPDKDYRNHDPYQYRSDYDPEPYDSQAHQSERVDQATQGGLHNEGVGYEPQVSNRYDETYEEYYEDDDYYDDQYYEGEYAETYENEFYNDPRFAPRGAFARVKQLVLGTIFRRPSPQDTSDAGERRARSQTFELAVLIVPTILLVLLVRAFVLTPFLIPSASMAPTLEVGDRVLLNRLSYTFGEVGRGDLVVASGISEVSGEELTIVKRVVGLPGETVEIRDNTILINQNLQLTETGYLPGDVISEDFGPIQVPEGELFLLGDNRQSSIDSRGELGTVSVEAVQGRAFLRWWPASRLAFL